MWEYQNTKAILQKVILQLVLTKLLWLKKLRLNDEETNKQSLGLKKLQQKVISFMLNGKVMTIHLMAGLLKKN